MENNSNKTIISTYRILKAKSFNEDVDESWIDWAIEMIEAGYESENLYMLAGERGPYNQFQLQILTENVFKDLNLDYNNRDEVARNFVFYLIVQSVDLTESYLNTLREIRNIYYQLNMDSVYLDFYLLYYAKDDLSVYEDQWYWPDANRENIDLIIREKFQEWIRVNELNVRLEIK